MRRLSAYYFMGQDLCLVRRHLRADLTWMAEARADAVAVGFHEFQLDYGTQQQLDILFKVLQEEDHSPHALAACGGPARGEAHRRRVVEFFGAANRRARERRLGHRRCGGLHGGHETASATLANRRLKE